MKWSNCQKSAVLKNDRSEMKMILMYSSWFTLKNFGSKIDSIQGVFQKLQDC